MNDDAVIEGEFREVREPRRVIWADRSAIALLLLINGLVGAVYAMWGDPGTFPMVETFGVYFAVFVWIIARTLDFLATGRIRYGT